jgi:hypothetical protein
MATVHPSSVLRSPDETARIRAKHSFPQDLEKMALLLQEKA